MEDPPLNRALRSIVESYLKQKTESEIADKSDARCSLHGEKLLLFCEHDKEPLCLVCQTSKKHRNHPVSPVEEAALDLKSQNQHTERQIKAEFEKLHQFLREEEEARLAALREEEKQRSQIMEQKIENITRHVSILTDKITAIEKVMETEDTSFLKSYKNIKERAQCTLQDPELLSGALIDVAKHLGNLKYRVWEKMLEMVQYTPVLLDPNTAHASLSLSDDLTTVTHTSTGQKCPDNPERFNPGVLVLGSEGFTSGKHSWEVKVGNKTVWGVGVVKESITRKGEITCSPKRGFWVMSLRNGEDYRAAGVTKLTLEKKPQSIRVQLDYDGGEWIYEEELGRYGGHGQGARPRGAKPKILLRGRGQLKNSLTASALTACYSTVMSQIILRFGLTVSTVMSQIILCHSFCRVCLQQYWEEKSSRQCPICRSKASVEDPPLNLALRSIVESYLKHKSESEIADKSDARCSLHGEKLLLFCEHDKEPLCVVCQTSKKHRNHSVCPVEEAALDLKEELKPALNLIKEKLKRFSEAEQQCKKTAEHIRSQNQHTERQIKAEFENLHQFLREEEEARLAALREEEKQRSQIMEQKIENITRHVSTLTDKITAIEKAMEAEDTSFLKSYKNIKERAQYTMQDPELLSGALIDVAKHLGNLKYRVWEKMLEMVQYTPVMLDPNTAHADLALSDDLTTVTHTGTEQKCPDNPERFSYCVDVLGSQGFTSGKHNWEVKVGNTTAWDVGVVKESITRKGDITGSPKRGFWVMMLRNGEDYSAAGTKLTLKRKPQSIRVRLDYDRGKVSFFDPSDMSHIYTFTDTFTERVLPYFSPSLKEDGNDAPLQICPVKVSVTVMSSQ
ncbi:hypothetical protein SKAU_G00142660 [Synaphobranchus kaupii]|uniref:Zinc-binding protein A33-like n=1 Tax=Synaphobranchus kaupii TaxID=118154 RepID=A0A9Q1J4K0_SYNKA|nr:hypothetical protein SKAU_G00142660 [Synaphobranchus kaupii]